MSDHTLTLGRVEGARGKRHLTAHCECGAAYTVHEGAHGAIAFEIEAPRRARIWHGDHKVLSGAEA